MIVRTPVKESKRMETIEYKGRSYPMFQAEGFAAQYTIPFAVKFCQGVGYDIGCMKKEWALPGSIPIDSAFDDDWDAYRLPHEDVDYIFSSHCLEHLPHWVNALDYWTKCLRKGGVLYLYLPHFSQAYWRPWNNRKHIHVLDRDVLQQYLSDNGYINIHSSGPDLNLSFTVTGEKG
tara:strand:- start:2173 stop:2700 length:528 start_codon:yes stop_codon:yes gene_type:complete